MRGNGWGKKHRVVDYVFKHSLHDLELYYAKIMQEMFNRGYKVSSEWFYRNYRGKHINTVPNDLIPLIKEKVYLEHDEVYMHECLENLVKKGIIIEKSNLR